MPQRLPRFYARLQRIEDERKIGEILREAGEVESEPGTALRRSADGHNRDRRRGLPVVSRGVGGASPGTEPLSALLAKEARGEVRL